MKWGETLCWRLMADFSQRTEVVALASFCKFPTVICKFRVHSFFFFSLSRLPSASFLEWDSIECLFVLIWIFLESWQPSDPLNITWKGASFRVCYLLLMLELGFLGPKGFDYQLSCSVCCPVNLRGWCFCKWSHGSFIRANVCHALLRR